MYNSFESMLFNIARYSLLKNDSALESTIARANREINSLIAFANKDTTAPIVRKAIMQKVESMQDKLTATIESL